MSPASAGGCIKKVLEINKDLSSLPVRKSWRCTKSGAIPSEYEDVPPRSLDTIQLHHQMQKVS